MNSPLDDAQLGSCVHCGLCLDACPTYLETGNEAESPRGRIHLMRALADHRLAAEAPLRGHLDSCLGCRACEAACPSGVPYGALIEATRPLLEAARPAPARFARRVLGRLLANRTLRELGWAVVGRAAGRSFVDRLARRTGSLALARLAALDPGPRPRLPDVFEPPGEARGTALLLTGCVSDTAFRATTQLAGRLLALAGVRVIVPAHQGCCGALALHLGDTRAAEQHLATLLETTAGHPADWIVPMAAGCGAHLQHADHHLPQSATAATAARRVIDPLALLAQLGLPAPRHRIAARVAVHDPCHLVHAQGVATEIRRLLATIPGMTLVPLSESEVCCGSAGTYNLTEPALARRLLARKLGHVAASGATSVAAANPGCLLQIRSGAIGDDLPVEVIHPLELLGRAHGI